MASRFFLSAAVVAASSLSAATALAGPVASRAAADPLADKRAQAVALAQRIQSLGQQEDALSEQYDQATLALQAAQARVTKANQTLAGDEHSESRARGALTAEAVNAYVDGGNEATAAAGDAPPLSDANQSLIRAEYLGNLTGDQNDVADQYHLASLKTSDDRIVLQSALGAAERQQSALAQDRQAVEASATQLQGTLNSLNGQIATLVAQAQEAQREADARAAQQRLIEQQEAAAQQAEAAKQAAALQAAAQQQAASQKAAAAAAALQTSGLGAVQTATAGSSTSAGRGTSATSGRSATTPAAGGSSIAARAIAAAESRLGDPYVWAATGPNSFDCSGLVMWSYAQAGVSLPHYSGAQYADTIHISMDDLEPGDLVFPADPGEHVAMYIGGGNIIEAPFTGEDVHIVPLSNFFVYASRVA